MTSRTEHPVAIDAGAAEGVFMPTELPPLLDDEFEQILRGNPNLLRQWVQEFGSPLHILWPERLKRNAQAFQAVARRQKVELDIFYGAKVNKSQALVRAAVEAGIGVDVSSPYELADALRAGLEPRRLVATGPAKTASFHRQLLARGALISLDSVGELESMQALLAHARPEAPARCLLRYRPQAARMSRFGMGDEDLARCLDLLARAPRNLGFEGFHFHLSGYEAGTRLQAIKELMPWIERARALGLRPQLIDIGGGMPIEYIDPHRYATYLKTHSGADYRHGRRPKDFYPYGGGLAAADWLEQLLASALDPKHTLAQALSSMGLRLAIEPGRSLVDQTAISVFRVNRLKPLAQGQQVVFVEGSSFSACETWFASEYLVDPILIGAAAAPDSPPTLAYIAGHSCLDDDVLCNRLVRFARPPQGQDLLVYANTAGYQMDLLENEFHRHPSPKRIAIGRSAQGGISVALDN